MILYPVGRTKHEPDTDTITMYVLNNNHHDHDHDDDDVITSLLLTADYTPPSAIGGPRSCLQINFLTPSDTRLQNTTLNNSYARPDRVISF